MLLAEGCELPGFAGLCASQRMSLAAQLIQYCWTHWDDPVDVSIMTCVSYTLAQKPVELV